MNFRIAEALKFVKMLYICKNVIQMNTQTRTNKIQTAFRFDPDLIRRAKNQARQQNLSLNAYVERLIADSLKVDPYKDLDEQLSHLKVPAEISPEIKALSRFAINFTDEELASDERLSYILSR